MLTTAEFTESMASMFSIITTLFNFIAVVTRNAMHFDETPRWHGSNIADAYYYLQEDSRCHNFNTETKLQFRMAE